MSTPAGSPNATLRTAWKRLAPLPGGKRLFSWLLRWMVPYSGTTRPFIEELSPGYVRVRIADRRGVRNHLHSVHAIALANVAELASGLAMTTALPDGIRGIVTRITVDYTKKARGTLTATARVTVPEVRGPVDHDVESVVTDAGGDVVARATVRWRLAPTPTPPPPRERSRHTTRSGCRDRGALDLRRHVSLLQSRAGRRSVGGGWDRHCPTPFHGLRPRARVQGRDAAHPQHHVQAHRDERADRTVLQVVPRPDAPVARPGARGRGALLRDLAGEPQVGGGADPSRGRRGLSRRHRAQMGAQGAGRRACGD